LRSERKQFRNQTGANVDFRKVAPGSEAMLAVFVKSADKNWEKFLDEVLGVMREECGKERKRIVDVVRVYVDREIKFWTTIRPANKLPFRKEILDSFQSLHRALTAIEIASEIANMVASASAPVTVTQCSAGRAPKKSRRK
jgi:hypothetical protein